MALVDLGSMLEYGQGVKWLTGARDNLLYPLGTVDHSYDEYDSDKNKWVSGNVTVDAIYNVIVDNNGLDSQYGYPKGDNSADEDPDKPSYLYLDYSDVSSTGFSFKDFFNSERETTGDTQFAVSAAYEIFTNNSSSTPMVLYNPSVSGLNFYRSDGTWINDNDGGGNSDPNSGKCYGPGTYVDGEYTCSPAKEVYFDWTEFDSSSVTLSSDGNAVISTGTITSSVEDLALDTDTEPTESGYATDTFTWYGPDASEFTVSTSSTDSISATTTNGVTNSSITSDTWYAGGSVTVEQAWSTGAPKVAWPSSTTTVSGTISSGYESVASEMNEVNFTNTTEEEEKSEFTISRTVSFYNTSIDPEEDGCGTFYDYTYSNVIDTDGDGVYETPVEEGLIMYVGRQYVLSIVVTETDIDSVITGDFDIGGSAGSISYVYESKTDGNNEGPNTTQSVGFSTAAELLDLADTYGGPSQFGYDDGAFGDISNGAISFSGEMAVGSSISTNFNTTLSVSDSSDETCNLSVTMSEDDGSSSSALASKIDLPKSMSLVSYETADSLGLKNITGNVLEYDIGLVNEYKQTNIGHWLDTHSQVGDKAIIRGGSTQKNTVIASEDGEHLFKNFQDSILRGNENDDKFVFKKKKSSGNSLHAEGGNDIVKSDHGQNTKLGSGDDTYVITGGLNHIISTGEGSDKVKLKSTDDTSFVISDFEPFIDTIKTSKPIDNTDLEVSVVQQSSTGSLAGASLEIKHKDELIGNIFFDKTEDSSFYDFMDEDRLAKIAFLNPAQFDLENVLLYLSAEGGDRYSSVELLELFLDKDILFKEYYLPEDWQAASSSEKAEKMYEAMDSLGSEVTQKQWKTWFASMAPSYQNEINFDTLVEHAGDISGLDSTILSLLG